ncbi:MAG: hypothetical protein CM1200mP13_01960 [Candidatus Pelagibacterales bacterium]|nr:MAG: hypothetical protein CM1200mP13_01960 [Pelagibacterales bacterium]
MQTETSGEFGGLVLKLVWKLGGKSNFPHRWIPADEVGVKAGDYIVKINEHPNSRKNFNRGC